VLEAYVGADNRPGMQPLNNKSSDEDVDRFNKNAHDAVIKIDPGLSKLTSLRLRVV
jgi:hypothetical protein